MERVQKSEAQIRQNRIIASCCITDARRRISDLMIEVSKRLVIEDGNMLDAEQVTPEAVEAAEKEEQLASQDFAQTIAASDKTRPDAQSEQPAQPSEPEKEAVSPEAPEEEHDSAETPEPDAQPVGQPDESHDESAGETQPSAEEAE